MPSLTNQSRSLQIHGLRDLVVFGINPLTGEACSYSQRILCDVNEAGKALLQEFLGLPTMLLAEPNNSQVNEQPSIGCVMLTRSSWADLAAFAAFYDGALGYVTHADASMVVLYDQGLLDRYAEMGADVTRNPALRSTAPRVGSRNVHQMTGRVL